MTPAIASAVAFGLSLAAYVASVPPGAYLVDSGTHLAAIATLGVTNPPGFPSYVVVAHLFAQLPLGSFAQRVHLFSALAAAVTCVLVFRLSLALLARRAASARAASGEGVLPSLAGALLLAFSYNFWSQAVNSESFAWTNLCALVTIHAFVRLDRFFEDAERGGAWPPHRTWMPWGAAAAVAFGTAAGGHPSIVCLGVGIASLLVRRFRALRQQPGPVLALLALFALVGVGWYSYLPMRAAAHPALDWGDPDTPARFLGHLYGRGLNVSDPRLNLRSGFTFLAAAKALSASEMARSVAIMATDFAKTFFLGVWQFTPFLVPVWAWAAVRAWRTRRPLERMIVVTAGFEFALSAVYHGANNENWHILPYALLASLTGAALADPGSIAPPRLSVLFRPLGAALVARPAGFPSLPAFVLAWTLAWHGSALLRRSHTLTDELCVNLYGALPKDAILLDRGDLLNSLNSYQRLVLRLRADVTSVVDNMLHAVDWHRDSLRRHGGAVLSDRLEGEIHLTDADAYHRIVNIFIEDNLRRRPVYMMPEVAAGLKLGSAFQQVPDGLAIRILPASEKVEPDPARFDFRIRDGKLLARRPFFLESSYRTGWREIRSFYAHAFLARGDWDLRAGKLDAARVHYVRAESFSPDSSEVASRLGILAGRTGDATGALAHFERAVKLAPDSATHRVNLGTALRQLNRNVEAQAQYRRAVDLDTDPSAPTAGIARQLLAELSRPQGSMPPAAPASPPAGARPPGLVP